MSNEEYKIELEKKLLEEYNEVIKADTNKECIEELAGYARSYHSFNKIRK